MMDNAIWFVENTLHLDDRGHEIVQELYLQSSLGQRYHSSSLDLSPLSSVKHLEYSPHSLLHWSLAQGRQVLELRRLFVSTLKSTPSSLCPVTRIVLPDPCLPSPVLLEDAETDLIHAQNLNLDEICQQYTLLNSRGRVSVMYHCIDLDTLVVGFGNGSLLQLNCPRVVDSDDPRMDASRLRSYQEFDLVEVNLTSSLSALMNTPSKLLSAAFRGVTGSSDQSSPSTNDSNSIPTSPDQPISISSLCYLNSLYLFTLSRNGKLRVWDLFTHTCLQTIPVVIHPTALSRMDGQETSSHTSNDKLESKFSSNDALLPPFPRNLLQVFNQTVVSSPESSFAPEKFFAHLLCYVGKRGSERSGFIAFETSCESTESSSIKLNPVWARDTSMFADEFLTSFVVTKNESLEPPSPLNRFGFPHFTLWATWDRRGVNSIRFTQMYLRHLDLARMEKPSAVHGVGDRWIPVLTNPPATVDIPGFNEQINTGLHHIANSSIQLLFLDHIFEAGRFPLSLIAEALGLEVTGPQTRSKLYQLALNQISRDIDFGEEAASFYDYQSEIAAQYNAFLGRIVQLYTFMQRNVSISYDPLAKKIVITKRGNSVSFLRLADISEVVGWTTPVGLGGRFVQATQPAFSLANAPSFAFSGTGSVMLASIEAKSLRTDMYHFLKVAKYVSSLPRMKLSLPGCLREWTQSNASFLITISDYVRQVYEKFQDDSEDSWPQILVTVRNGLQKIGHFQCVLRVLLDMLSQPASDALSATESSSSRSGKPTPLTYGCIAHSVKDILDTRYHLITQVLTLLIVVKNIDLGDPQYDVPDAMVSETLVLLNVYHRLVSLGSIYLVSSSPSKSRVSALATEQQKNVSRTPYKSKKRLDVLNGFSELSVSSETTTTSEFQEQEEWFFLHLLKHHVLIDVDVELYASPALNEDTVMTSEANARPGSWRPLPETLLQAALSFIIQLNVLHPKSTNMTNSTKGFVRLCHKLIVYGHGQFIAPLLRGLTRRSAAAEYLLGVTWMDSFEWEKAERCFEKAAIGVTHALKDTSSREKARTRPPFSQTALDGEQDDSAHWLFKAIVGDVPLTALDESVQSDQIKGSRALVVYYVHVMNLFLERSVLDKAVYFGQLALTECSASEIQLLMGDTRVMLYNTLFKTALDMCDFDTAYTALLNHADPDSKRTCLRNFVTALCEHGDLDGLCTRYAFPHLTQEVEEALLFKARASSVRETLFGLSRTDGNGTTQPNYFKICYSYFTFRGNLRSAATSMYTYARKVHQLIALYRDQPQNNVDSFSQSKSTSAMDETIFHTLLTELAQALLSAWNALGLVSPVDQWISVEVESSVKDMSLSKKRQFSELLMDDTDEDFDETGTHVVPRATSNRSVDVVTLNDIRREYHLVDARLSLAQLLNTGANDTTTFGFLLSSQPSDIISQFCRIGQFDKALETCFVFDLEPSRVFVRLAEKCVSLSEMDLESATPMNKGALWNELKTKLERHDSKESGYSLHVAVIRTLLQQNKRIRLPTWLTSALQTSQPQFLLQLYLEFGRLNEAYTVAASSVELQMVGVTINRTPLPVSWIDTLLASGNKSSSSYQLLATEWQLYQSFVASTATSST